MKKILLTLFVFLFIQISKGQLSYTDSLLKVIRSSKDAQSRLETARHYTWHYAFKSIDSLFYCGYQLIQIGKDFHYTDMTAYGETYIAYAYLRAGRIYEALSTDIESLKLAEKNPNSLLLSYIYTTHWEEFIKKSILKSLYIIIKKPLSM